MANCLGIYIGKSLIKYAKVSNDGGGVKIITSGVKAYTDLKATLQQIVNETDSVRIPISVNIEGEKYNYFTTSSLLTKSDLTKAITTEFESYCYEKGENPNTVVARFALVNDTEDKNRIRVIHVSEDKIKLNQLQADFTGLRLSFATPMPLSIANIAPLEAKENVAIVNIEDKTSITVVVGQKVYEVKKLDVGAEEILNSIAARENSYAKAYEICKNTTIYTMQNQDLQEEKNEYLADIVPNLYTIGEQIKNYVFESEIKINKVYLTGTAAVINNIDLYLNEIIGEEICEVLKPFFLEDNAQVNIKDCIEANSAIALAMQGLEFGIKDLNFVKESSKINIGDFFSTITVGGKPIKFKKVNMPKVSIKGSGSEFALYCLAVSIAFLVIYSSVIFYTANEIRKKRVDVQKVEDFTNEQITKIQKDTTNMNAKQQEYIDLTKNLQNAKDTVNEKNSYRNSIPTLLSEIISIIPKGVKLTGIENTSGKNIVIKATSLKYEQLAYFKAKLRSEGVLKPDTVVSSPATKSGENVSIIIEGELP